MQPSTGDFTMRYQCVAFLLVLGATGLIAQQPQPSDFWQVPGETMRDKAGTIIYQVVKDPDTFTMRVYDHGTLLTYRFQPNTDRVIRVEAPDISEDYTYTDAET